MTWRESTCPICGVDTSGTLPLTFYIHGRGELHGEWCLDRVVRVQYYPCDEHYDVIMKLMEYEQWEAIRATRG